MYGIDNEGVELEVKGELVRGRTWQWNLSFNVSRNRNRLARSLNGRDFQNTAARFANNLSVIGLPLYGIYAFDDRGIYDSQSDVPSYYEDGVKKYLRGEGSAYYRAGDRIITDVDGNGQIYNYGTLAEDRIYIGSPCHSFRAVFPRT